MARLRYEVGFVDFEASRLGKRGRGEVWWSSPATGFDVVAAAVLRERVRESVEVRKRVRCRGRRKMVRCDGEKEENTSLFWILGYPRTFFDPVLAMIDLISFFL